MEACCTGETSKLLLHNMLPVTGDMQTEVKQARRVVTALNVNMTLTMGYDYMAVVDTRLK